MKVFIAGATGVLGKRVVRRLIAGGHQVVGLSRSQANVDWLSRQGAEPRRGDLFDQEQVCDLASDCDAVLHLATSIPTRTRTTLRDWALNDRIRREGARNLVEATLRNECAFYLQQSISFIYGDRQGARVDETTPIPDRQVRILQSAVDMEGTVQDAVEARQLPAVILRFGSFYGSDSAQTRTMFEMAQKGRFPVIGSGEGYWNVIHLDDAAGAVVQAVEGYEGNLGQVFNVCDDQPVPYRELVEFVAETLGSKRPGRIPRFLAKLLLGSQVVDTLLASVRCENARVKDRLAWQPVYATYREGYGREIERWLGGVDKKTEEDQEGHV